MSQPTFVPTPLDTRSLLVSMFPEAQPPQAQAPASAADVLAAASAAQAWFFRLLLPRLSAPQRLRLARAAGQGVPQFLRAYERIARSPAFRRAVRLSGPDLSSLRRLHGALSRTAVLALRLEGCAAAGERWALSRLRAALDRLSETAEALGRDDATDESTRRAAAAFAAALQGQRARQDENDEEQARKAAARLRRAETDQAAALRTVSETELRRALLGGDDARTPPAVPALSPAPARRRPVFAQPGTLEGGPAGAPLDRCLLAPAADYAACIADLEERLEDLCFPDTEGRGDAVADGDLALLMAPVLQSVPWLETAAEVSGQDLEELCDLRAVCGGLQKMAALLFQGARDGLLCAGTMVLEVHGRAQGWLAGAGDDAETAELRVLVEGAEARLQEGAARREAPRATVEGKVAALHQETAERLEEADFNRTMAGLRAGEDVAPEALERAAAFKKGRETTRRANRPARRRPR